MADALDRAMLFEGLSAEALAALKRIAVPFSSVADEVLFRQGNAPTGLYVVDTGLLEIATRMPGDSEARVSRIGPGEVVGEFALLDPGPRSARVVAVEPCTGQFLPARSFMAMVEEGRAGGIEAVDRLRVLVARRTRATIQRLAEATAADDGELRAASVPTATPEVALDFEVLRSLGRFAPFDDAEGAAFLAQGNAVAIERRGRLAAAGEESDAAWLVVRGAIRAAFDRGAHEEQVTIHGPGEWAGLVETIDPGERPLTLSAAEDSLLFRVPAQTFACWRAAPEGVEHAALAACDRQLVRDQRRANRHLGRAIALDRFNAGGDA